MFSRQIFLTFEGNIFAPESVTDCPRKTGVLTRPDSSDKRLSVNYVTLNIYVFWRSSGITSSAALDCCAETSWKLYFWNSRPTKRKKNCLETFGLTRLIYQNNAWESMRKVFTAIVQRNRADRWRETRLFLKRSVGYILFECPLSVATEVPVSISAKKIPDFFRFNLTGCEIPNLSDHNAQLTYTKNVRY